MNSIKNHLTLFASCFFVSSFGYAQINAVATYTYEQPKVGFKENYKLVINDGIYAYQHHHNYSEIVNDKGWEFYFHKDYYDWFYDTSKKKIKEQRVLKDGTKVIASWEANLKWEITEETKEIGGYKVQKAITQAHELAERGSDWDYGNAIAWFTTEIPISAGPERYYGLPGLIVYLEFTERSMVCTLIEIQWDTGETIIFPEEGIEITKEQMLRTLLIPKKWLKQQKKTLAEAKK